MLHLSSLENTTIRTLSDIIAFNINHAPLEMPPNHCCQEIFLIANNTNGTKSPEFLAALAHLHKLSRDGGIESTMKNFNVDLLVVPADASGSTTISAVSGWPIATIPVGVLNGSGRPFGLAIFTSGADGMGEERLMRLMGDWWKVAGKRRAPGGLRQEVL